MKKESTIPTPHYSEIQDFLNKNNIIATHQQANDVLAYLLPLKDEWKEYYKVVDSFVFPHIYESIACSFQTLGKYEEAISFLEECLKVIESATEYQWLFNVKSQLYQLLTILYFEQDDIETAKKVLNDSIFYFLLQCNHTHYDNFDFYSFRPLSDYLLDSITNNYITVTDPQEFNDPVDPPLLSHLDYLINNTENTKDKQLYNLQKEIYGKVRIRCLLRTLPLPLKEGRDLHERDANERERNLTTMWAYYADNHKGICIKYVLPKELTAHETNKDSVLLLHEVSYQQYYELKKDAFNFQEALFSKGLFWQHEHESRLVYFHRYKDDKFIKIDIPNDCITEIYIGVRTTLLDKLKIKEAIKDKPNIKLFQMKISDTNLFQLEAESIDRSAWLNDKDDKIALATQQAY